VGRIRFGSAEAHAPGQQPAVSAEQKTWARESLSGLLPIYKDLPQLESRAHRLVVTNDLRPIVGPVRGVEGLFVVAGFTGNDFQLAPSIGEGLAQMVLGQPISAFDPAFFSPERFA
jgi:glycine/D-amino acid oxidase-like deaminating enzyme